jgi:predicted ribosome quality control (RQC) complex YloA/Tae2 family protein
MEWKDLPRATFSSFGTVKVSDHVKINDTRTDVVPNCKTFSAIEENITKKLRGALRAYMTSEEFTKKVYLMQEEIANSLINMEETIATQSNIIEQLTAELNT